MFITNAFGDNIGVIPLNEAHNEKIMDEEITVPVPVLVLRNAVLFPTVVFPITVSREKSIKLIREAYSNSTMICAVGQKDPKVEDPACEELYYTGSLARILKIFEMPDGGITALLQGIQRVWIEEFVQKLPFFTAYVSMKPESEPEDSDSDYNAIVGAIKDSVSKMMNYSTNLPPEATFAIKNIENKKLLINFLSSNIELENSDNRQMLLELDDMKERALKLVELMGHELQLMEIKHDIQQKVRSEMDQQQREYFLHQQIKTIQNELGNSPVES